MRAEEIIAGLEARCKEKPEYANDPLIAAAIKALSTKKSRSNTVGQTILNMFPNLEVGCQWGYAPSVDLHNHGTMVMRIDRNLWDALYADVIDV